MLVRLLITLTLLFAFGATLMLLIHRLRCPWSERVRDDWLKYAVFAGVVTGVIAVAGLGRIWTAFMLGLLSVYGSLELTRHLRLSILRRCLITGFCTIALSLLLAHLLLLHFSAWDQRFVFGFVMVAITDSFSQLWGRLLGRHRLCPVLSPNKTWEGLCGGFLTAIVGARLFGFLLPRVASRELILAGALIALVATSGDLLFSAAKRSLRIKDFSNLLPGHGGLLDRFDSLVIAAPCIYWIDRLMLK